MIELSIVKTFLKNKEIYDKYFYKINKLTLEKEIKLILSVIDNYYVQYSEHDYISKDEFIQFFDHLYPQIKDRDIYIKLIEQCYELETSDSLASDIIVKLIEKEYVNKIIQVSIPILSGESSGVIEEIENYVDEYKAVVQQSAKEQSPFIEDDLDSLIETEVNTGGLTWRLNGLNHDIGALRGGDLGHVYARPDTGKTTFLLSEASHLARQLNEDETGLWFNNEERGNRVRLRWWSAVLGAPLTTIMNNKEAAKKAFITNGGHKVKLKDEACIDIKLIETYLKEYSPRFVLIDQGDKVTFRGDGGLAGHDRLKSLYVQFRELAKKYNTSIITAGQASNDAHNRKWIELNMMDNSKTGKPGELDFAIGIGACSEGEQSLRYIHIVKNKHGGKNKWTSIMEPLKARYLDV